MSLEPRPAANPTPAPAPDRRPAPPLPDADVGDDGEREFHMTIKKLEVPVRPRGVLAE